MATDGISFNNIILSCINGSFYDALLFQKKKKGWTLILLIDTNTLYNVYTMLTKVSTAV